MTTTSASPTGSDDDNSLHRSAASSNPASGPPVEPLISQPLTPGSINPQPLTPETNTPETNTPETLTHGTLASGPLTPEAAVGSVSPGGETTGNIGTNAMWNASGPTQSSSNTPRVDHHQEAADDAVRFEEVLAHLAADRAERLERKTIRDEQRAFQSMLTDTPLGRRLLTIAYPEESTVADSVVAEVQALATTMTEHHDPHRRNAAAVAINRVSFAAARSGSHSEPSAMYQRLKSAYSSIDQWWRRDKPVASAKKLTHASANIGRIATFLAAAVLLLSTGAHSSEGTGQTAYYWIAAGILAARITMTGVVWRVAHFPSDTTPDRPRLTSSPASCVLDHAGDAALIASMGAAVIASGHPRWGGVIIASAFLFIFATLFRASTTLYGVFVGRLHLERVMRGGASLCALVIVAADPGLWLLASAIAVVGPGLFALIEVREASRALRSRLAALGKLPAPVQQGPAARTPHDPADPTDREPRFV